MVGMDYLMSSSDSLVEFSKGSRKYTCIKKALYTQNQLIIHMDLTQSHTFFFFSPFKKVHKKESPFKYTTLIVRCVWRSKVGNGNVKEVTKALRLIQVIDVVMVTRRRGQTEERRENF